MQPSLAYNVLAGLLEQIVEWLLQHAMRLLAEFESLTLIVLLPVSL